jgi:ribosomal protein L35
MAKPKRNNDQVLSLASSKQKFKRDRKFDNHILNERSGDLMSQKSSQKMLTPA